MSGNRLWEQVRWASSSKGHYVEGAGSLIEVEWKEAFVLGVEAGLRGLKAQERRVKGLVS
jgi:hypothetical protein